MSGGARGNLVQVVDEELSIRVPDITAEGPVIDRAAEGRDRAAVQEGGGEWQWGLGGRRRELPVDPPRVARGESADAATRAEQKYEDGVPGGGGKDTKTIDALVLDRFLSILGDTRLRMWVYQSKPANCHDAVMTAVGAEAYLKHEADQRQEVRAADASVAEHMHSQGGRMDKLADGIAALTSKVDQGGQGGQSSKKWPVNRACYHCNQEGHFKRECPLLMGRNRFGGGSAGPSPGGGPAHPAAPASKGIAANLQSPNQVAGN